MRSREFEASIIIVKHDFDLSEIKTELMQGFRITALTSGLRQKEVEDMSEEHVLRYFRKAGMAFAICSSLQALNGSSRLEVKSYLQNLGLNDMRLQMWERVLAQYRVPSALTELFRLSYSPVVLGDGTLILAMPCDISQCNPMDYLFTNYIDTLISRVYTSSLAHCLRTDVASVYPMVYQHVTHASHIPAQYTSDVEWVVDRERVDAAVKEYAQYLTKGKKAKLSDDAMHVRNVAEKRDLSVDQLAVKLSYDDFKFSISTSKVVKKLVTPAIDVEQSPIMRDLMFPEGSDVLIISGQIFGAFSRIANIKQIDIRSIIKHDEAWKEIQVERVIGFSSLENTSTAPIVIDKSLVRYAVDRVSKADQADWWLKTFMEKANVQPSKFK